MNQEQHPNPIKRWKHRRQMAYGAVLSGMFYPLLVLMTDSNVLANLAWPFYGLFVAPVAASYIGAAAWETIKISEQK